MSSVSVIVPVYNEIENLKICLDSLLCQQYGDYEVVLVDDGSESDSLEISCAYANCHTIIRLFKLKNGGVSRARNVGMNFARGEFITFVDSDDIVSPLYISNLVNSVETAGVDCAVGMGASYYPNSHVSFRAGKTELLDCAAAARSFAEDYGWFCWGKLYRRKMLLDNGILFNENIAVCEDLLFNYEVLRVCNRIAFNTGVDYLYRQSIGSATNRLDNERWFDVLKVYDIALKKTGVNESLLSVLAFNCEFILHEAQFRLQYLSPENREEAEKNILKIWQLLPKRQHYSMQQKIKLLAFAIFPNLVMRIRRRRLANNG
jgi:glycosyltransferase involved in cell wall biosynthesis